MLRVSLSAHWSDRCLQDTASEWFGMGRCPTAASLLSCAHSLAKQVFNIQLSPQPGVCHQGSRDNRGVRSWRSSWDHPAGQERIQKQSVPSSPHSPLRDLLLEEEQRQIKLSKLHQRQARLTKEHPKPLGEGTLRNPSSSYPCKICSIICNGLIGGSHDKEKHLIKTLMLQTFTST